MESRLRVLPKTTRISVPLILALSLLTAPMWAQSGTISGTVQSSEGDRLPGALVSLQNEDGSDAGQSAFSDTDGAFSIANVAAGTYTVTAGLAGFKSLSEPVVVTASAEVTLVFELSGTYHDVVMVTAEKTEENILEVPMTITAFDSSMLEELVVQDRADLQNLVPGLQFGDEQEQVGQGTVIRGIGSRLAGETHSDLAVATYVDGAYTLGAYAATPGGGFDLDRIEVARGPQGTLNGRNSIAGSINLVTKRPTNQWDADLMIEATDVSQQRYNAAIGGPLSDNFSFRVTGGVHTGDGIQDNVGGPDYDAPDQTFWAPQLRVSTDRFDMNVRWSHVEDEGVPRAMVQASNLNRTDPFLPASGAPDETGTVQNDGYLWATPNPAINPNCPVGVPGYECGDLENKLALNFPGFQDSESDLITLYAQYQVTDGLSLRYSFSESDVAMVNAKDSDYTNRVPVGENPGTLDHTLAADGGVPFRNRSYTFPYLYDETSHELQFSSSSSGPFNFIAGLFTYENNTDWEISWNDFHTPFRFGTADEQAVAASPIFGFVPVSSCQDILTDVIVAFGIGTTEPDASGTFWVCPEGSEHTFNNFFTGASSETQAAFFSGDYQFNDHWALSGGVRYTEDEKKQGGPNQGFFVNVGFAGVTAVTSTGSGNPDAQTWDQPIGHLSLEYTSDSGNLIYGRVSTGYRAGAFNTQVLGLPPPLIEEETLVNYEVGTKGFFLNSRLQLSAGLWFNDFDGYQLNATQEPPPGVPFPVDAESPLVEYTSNVDDTQIWGADFEFSYYMSNQWSLRGFYAYQDSEVGPHSSVLRGNPDAQFGEWEHLDLSTGQMTTSFYELATDQTGNRLPVQPENKLALTLNYQQSFGNAGSIQLMSTYAFTDKRFADIGNLPIYELPSFDRWDAGVTWSPASEAFSVSLFVQNITDEIGIVEYVPQSTNGGFAHLAVLTNPTEYGLQLRWRPFR